MLQQGLKKNMFTRIHSSRMPTAGSLTVSPYLIVFAGGACVACTPLPCTPLPCMPPCHAPCHVCPLPHMPPTMHAPLPCTPPPCTPPAMHTPPPCTPLPCMPPCHAPPGMHPPCGQTDTCKNITFANFICGQ